MGRRAPGQCAENEPLKSSHGSQTQGNDTETFLTDARSELNNLHVMDLARVDREAQEGAHAVKPVQSRSTWIDVQAAPTRVAFHPQQVAVPANEHIRPLRLKQRPHPAGIPPGPSADVPHQAPQAAAFPTDFLRKLGPCAVIVDVPEDDAQGGHGCQCIRHVEGADVPSMPDLVHPPQVVQNAVVHVAVGVGKQADAHGANFGVQVAAFLAQIAAMIHRFLSLATALLVLSVAAIAQPTLTTENKRAAKAYGEALEAYLHGRLGEALEALDGAIRRDASFFEAWMLKGQLLDEAGFLSEAADAYQHGYATAPQRYPQGRVRVCELLHASGRYADGLQAYADAAASLETPLEGEGWETVYAHLTFAAAAVAEPVDLENRPLAGEVNTDAPEYYPAITADGQTLLFTRQIMGNRAFEGQEDFFTAHPTGPHSWGTVQPLRGINTPSNEGAPALQGDGQRLIFTACSTVENGYGERTGKGSCDLFESVWDAAEGRFTLGTNLGAPNTAVWESQPSLSADGQTLLFVRARRETRDTPAEQDIFQSTRRPDGSWSPAVRLPGPINTPGTEGNPVLHPDGSTLYFVSDGHPGMGGLDLFRSVKGPDGMWGPPVNLGYPINTHHDESSVLVTPDGRWAMFATDREEPGNLDLWELRLPEEHVANEVRVLRGYVVDAADGQPVEADVDVVRPDGQLIARVRSNGGRFELPFPDGDALRFRVDHPWYAFYSEQVVWNEVDPDERATISLTRFEVGTVLTLKDVRFASGSSTLEAVFQPELEQLAALMLANDAQVQIVGHTDNRGNAADNLVLSLERAEAVRNYLLERGVAADRMAVEGQGDAQPIASNDTEAGRAQNRRTEIIVVEEGSK